MPEISTQTTIDLLRQLQAGELTPEGFARVLNSLSRGQSAATPGERSVLSIGEARQKQVLKLEGEAIRTARKLEDAKQALILENQRLTGLRGAAQGQFNRLMREAVPFGTESPQLKAGISTLQSDTYKPIRSQVDEMIATLRSASGAVVAEVKIAGQQTADQLSRVMGRQATTLATKDVAMTLAGGGSITSLVTDQVAAKPTHAFVLKEAAEARRLERAPARLERATVRLQTGLESQGVPDRRILSLIGAPTSRLAAEEIAGLPKARQSAAIAKTVGRSSNFRRGGKGALGGLALSFIADKLFGGKEPKGQQIPPEIQMALAQQLGGRQGDQGIETGRTLRNIGQLITIMKGLGSLQQLSGAQGAPELARIV